MSNYAEDYQISTDEQKLDILNVVYNMKNTTKEQKDIILKETQKIYTRIKRRE